LLISANEDSCCAELLYSELVVAEFETWIGQNPGRGDSDFAGGVGAGIDWILWGEFVWVIWVFRGC
jgi:hypothetical protein